MILLRPLTVCLLLLDVPHVWQHDGWRFYAGGDEIEYFELARSLVDGHPVASSRTLGYPLLLAPLAAAAGAQTARDLQPWIVLLQAMMLGAVVTWLVERLARLFVDGDAIPLAAAAAFALLPWWLLLPGLWPPKYYEALSGWNLSYQLGLVPYADLPSQAAEVAAILLFVRAAARGSGRLALAAGAVAGMAGLIRVTNIPPLGGLVLFSYLLQDPGAGPNGRRSVKRALGVGAAYGGAALAVFLPQFVYNAIQFGHPLQWGYVAAAGERAAGHRLDAVLAVRRWAAFFLSPVGGIWKAVAVGALARFFWISRRRESLAAAWCLVSYATILFAYPLFGEDPFRLAMPLAPFLALGLGALSVWIGGGVYRFLERLAPRSRSATAKHRSA